MRGVKQAAMTQPEADDPLKEMYGDLEMVQSKTSATKAFTRVEDLEPSLAGQQVGSSNTAHGLWVIPKLAAQQLHSRLQPKPSAHHTQRCWHSVDASGRHSSAAEGYEQGCRRTDMLVEQQV